MVNSVPGPHDPGFFLVPERHLPLRGNPVRANGRSPLLKASVIPAQAGIQKVFLGEIPVPERHSRAGGNPEIKSGFRINQSSQGFALQSVVVSRLVSIS